MKMLKLHLALAVTFLATLFACTSKEYTTIQWQHQLDQAVFDQAKKDDKLVVLTLKANWCHWCHVMDDSTFSNKQVIQLLGERFIAVSLDQDANPALASRYREYGWPATIIFDSKGNELVKNAGYANPSDYLKLLNEAIAIVNGEQTSTKKDVNNLTSDQQLEQLSTNFDQFQDQKLGGFPTSMKYAEEESMEYALQSSTSKNWAIKTIEASFALNDPVFGGVYQYSTYGDWQHPHYEKLLTIQARHIRLYSTLFTLNNNEAAKNKALQIRDYCKKFLKQSNGLMGNAQDADLKKGEKAHYYFSLNDQKRRALGIPAVDTNCYTHSNADYAVALLKLYDLTNNDTILAEYQTILTALRLRKNEKGLYNHGYKSAETDALRDNVAMANLFVSHLKTYPSDQNVKRALHQLLSAIHEKFKIKTGEYSGFSGDLGIQPKAILSENILLGRLFSWYGLAYKAPQFKNHSRAILHQIMQKANKESLFHEPDLLSFAAEINTALHHVVAVNDNENLLSKARIIAPFNAHFETYIPTKNVELDQQFKGIEYTALFVCGENFCSPPLKTKAAIINHFTP